MKRLFLISLIMAAITVFGQTTVTINGRIITDNSQGSNIYVSGSNQRIQIYDGNVNIISGDGLDMTSESSIGHMACGFPAMGVRAYASDGRIDFPGEKGRYFVTEGLSAAFHDITSDKYSFFEMRGDSIVFEVVGSYREEHPGKDDYKRYRDLYVILPDGNHVLLNNQVERVFSKKISKVNIGGVDFSKKGYTVTNQNDKYVVFKKKQKKDKSSIVVLDKTSKTWRCQDFEGYDWYNPELTESSFLSVTGQQIWNLSTDSIKPLPEHIFIYDNSDDIFMVLNTSNQRLSYSFFYPANNQLLPISYDNISRFHNGVSFVVSNGKGTYIDQEGSIVFENLFTENPFMNYNLSRNYWGNSFGIILQGGRWGVVDTIGNTTFGDELMDF